ncbi:MAG: 50S ribosomal protein L29 [Dehalococcoidia bacterium]
MTVTRVNRKADEIRRLSDSDLAKELEEAHRRLFSLRLRWVTRQESNYRLITQIRRRIARLKTIEKQRQEAAQAAAQKE